MLLTHRMRYVEMVVPPRCRKPRPEEWMEEVRINIPEIPGIAAQVAFLVWETQREERKVILYRGKLYRQFQDMARDIDASNLQFRNRKAEDVDWSQFFRCYIRERGSREEYLAYISRRAKPLLIVDGWLYERCYEPYYSYMTFGLGRNHGGTGFFVYWAEPNKRKMFGWSALNTERAIEGAVRMALARGDTDSEEYIRAGGNGHILCIIPEAVKRIYDNPDDHLQSDEK